MAAAANPYAGSQKSRRPDRTHFLYIAVIAVVPSILFFFTGNQLIQAFGGTSILIMIGVALDTMTKVESQLKMHNYEGFFK